MRTIYFEKDIPRNLLVKALRPIWPNVVFSALSATRFVDLPEVPLPGRRWVRVRNRLGGICASDLHLVFVDAGPRASVVALPATERIYLGHEAVGVVSEAGADVDALQVGDRVIIDSEGPSCLNQEIEPPCRHCRVGDHLICDNTCLSEGARGVGGGWGDGFTAHETAVIRVPDALDDDAAMMIEPLAVSVRAVLRRLPGADERALVVGSGTIGLGVVQALRALSPGCHVTVIARYPQQVAMARKLGANEVLVHEDPYEATARITAGKLYSSMFNNCMILGGFDVIYDCVGSGRTVTDCLRWARAGGAVVLVGARLEPVRVDLTPVWHQEVDLVGLLGHGLETWNGTEQTTYDLTANLLRDGKLTVDGFITHRFPLDQWQDAVRTAVDKHSGAIKVAFDLGAEG